MLNFRKGKQTTVIQILGNICQIKGNRIIKFDQLIEYKVRNIFLKKSCIKCGGETVPRSFSKKIKIEYISGSIV